MRWSASATLRFQATALRYDSHGDKQTPHQTIPVQALAQLDLRRDHAAWRDIMTPYRIAILWRGTHAGRRAATPRNNRYHRIFEELAALGIGAEPAVYADDIAGDVRT